jgi:hypothetical protein
MTPSRTLERIASFDDLHDCRVVLSGAIARQAFDASAPQDGRFSINL